MNELKLVGPEEMAMGGRGAPSGDTVLNRAFFGFWTTDSWRPSVNLYETPDAFVICADIAGMDKDRIDVRVDQRQLTIRGRRYCPTPPGMSRTVAVHLMEIDHGVFGRTVEIPANVDGDAIAAEYNQGLLWITLPKVG